MYILSSNVKNVFSSPPIPPLEIKFRKIILHCHDAIKFCMANKLTIVNKIDIRALHRNITHLAVTTRKTTKKMKNLNCEWKWKRAQKIHVFFKTVRSIFACFLASQLLLLFFKILLTCVRTKCHEITTGR